MPRYPTRSLCVGPSPTMYPHLLCTRSSSTACYTVTRDSTSNSSSLIATVKC
ncbi:hypothetical protein JHK87_027276 [Glycine soja]|nr:hypothetical protein JHK87_027276 [Glycine soja]